MKLRDFFENIRKKLLAVGYACDNCGAELFEYPQQRLCPSCEGKLPRIEKACPKCGRERVSEGVCLTCKSKMPKFTQGVSAFSYKGEAAGMVNRMKNGKQRLAAYFGERMAERVLPLLSKDEGILILPVPLTARREKERGYNQAQRLAEAVQNRLKDEGINAELDLSVLEKRRETELQKQKTGRERVENVKGAYHVHKRKACENKTLLLIDDILTTGATGSECARILSAAGAKRVLFLTAAALPEQR